MTRYLTTEDLLLIIEELGVGPIQDLGALDSAAHRPAATVLGRDAYPDLMLKAAVLLESLVRNHPLVDGNKRLGWTSTVVFLALNGNALTAPEDPAYDLVIATSQGQARPEQIAAQLAQWCATAGPTSSK